MYHRTRQLILFAALAALTVAAEARADELLISPGGGARDAILAKLATAETEILVFSYAFNSRILADALLDATRRGVQVHILLDRLQSRQRNAKTNDLANGCTSCLQARTPGVQHAKTIVIDRRCLITGSYNWTDAAEHANIEHLWILDNPTLATQAANHWHQCAQRATPVIDLARPRPAAASCPSGRCTHPLPSIFRRP
jgi:phosphatidylserine/phosphatidylglycerophosphate/cardiolipin synthase-like enzyme